MQYFEIVLMIGGQRQGKAVTPSMDGYLEVGAYLEGPGDDSLQVRLVELTDEEFKALPEFDGF